MKLMYVRSTYFWVSSSSSFSTIIVIWSLSRDTKEDSRHGSVSTKASCSSCNLLLMCQEGTRTATNAFGRSLLPTYVRIYRKNKLVVSPHLHAWQSFYCINSSVHILTYTVNCKVNQTTYQQQHWVYCITSTWKEGICQITAEKETVALWSVVAMSSPLHSQHAHSFDAHSHSWFCSRMNLVS